ncbi:hypothetical protein JCM3774_005987 [Rhodotorula dairenensis]
MSDSVAVHRWTGASSPALRTQQQNQQQPFSASAFDDFMGLPTSNSNERVTATAPSPINAPQRRTSTSATTATAASSSLGRKLRSFPWSRSASSSSSAGGGGDKKKQQRGPTARERIVSSAGPDAPRPGPSILKPTPPSSSTLGSPSSSSLPMGFPAPPPSSSSSLSSSSAASLSTGTSFASTALFSTSNDDTGWHSEATTVSLNSSPEIGAGGTFKSLSNDSLIQLRDSRRAAKEKDAVAALPQHVHRAARPFSTLSDIVERDSEDGRASMYDVLSLYSVTRGGGTAGNGTVDVPVRRVSTPIPPAVALMLAAEPPATPPPARQKRWSTSSIEESPSQAKDEQADDEVSPPPPQPPRRRRNSFDSPRSSPQKRPSSTSSSSVRIPSMRFDGISMEAMFAEVEARVNRQLAAKQLVSSSSSSSSSSGGGGVLTENDPDAMINKQTKQARRKSRVVSLQEPLSFEISQPVFDDFRHTAGASSTMTATVTRREVTIIEEEEEEEEEGNEPPSGSATAYRTVSNPSRPEPVDVGAANSAPFSRWAPRSAPLQPSGPFFAAASSSSSSSPRAVSPPVRESSPSTIKTPAVVPEGATAVAAPSLDQKGPRTSIIPELTVCPPSPPERPKRRAPPPPLRLGSRPTASAASSPRPFPTMVRPQQQQQLPSPASPSPSLIHPAAFVSSPTMVNGETKVTLVDPHREKKNFVRMSTRAQTTRRTDRPKTFSVPPPGVAVSPTRQIVPYSPSSSGTGTGPRTPLTPTFEITPPPPEEEEADSPPVEITAAATAAEMVALPISEPSTPVRRFMVEGGSPVSPTLSSTSTVTGTTATPYHPPNVLRTDYHPALSNLTVAYPHSDESSSSECEESIQDMLIRLSRPHTPPPPRTTTTTTKKDKTVEPNSAASFSLTKSAIELHNTSHSRLSMLARELGETMLGKENVAPSLAVGENQPQQQQQQQKSKRRGPSTDSRRYSKLFAAGEVDLDQFQADGAQPVLVSPAAVEPQSPTLMHLLKPIASEHGHADEEETWTARDSHEGTEEEEEDEAADASEVDAAGPAHVAVGSADLEHYDLDLESELDRTLALLISDESAASSTTTTSSTGRSSHSHGRTDSDSSLASFDHVGAVIVEAKVVVPRSPVVGHQSQLSDSSIGSSDSTDAGTDVEEGVVCLGERISCSYNVGVIGVAM